MVNYRSITARPRPGSWFALLTSLIVLAGGSSRALATDPSPDPVRAALGRGSFPWYDAPADKVQTVKLPRQPDLGSNRSLPAVPAWRVGDYLVFGIFALALIGLITLVALNWKRFEPTRSLTTADQRPAVVLARSGEALPAGLRGAGVSDDPWAEANRRRLAGDFAGAVVCLFAHQLLTLSRLNLVRLAPGRTGRQLHRAVSDAEFQTLMTPTLRQFEAVYYGHRTPTAADFAIVWAAAESFQQRTLTQVAT